MLGIDTLSQRQLLHDENQVQTWLCENSNGQKYILKKAVKEEANDALDKEIWSIQQLASNNFANTIKAQGYDESGHKYFVRDYFVSTLAADLSAENTIDFKKVCACALNVLNSLKALHMKGFIHADLKTENILITEDGTAVLADYGSLYASTSIAQRQVAVLPFWRQELMGNEYFSPSWLTESTQMPDESIDIFAFGKVLALLLEKLPKSQQEKLQSLSTRCIDEPSQRPKISADECINAINEALGNYEKFVTKPIGEFQSVNKQQHEEVPTKSKIPLLLSSIIVVIVVVFVFFPGSEPILTEEKASNDRGEEPKKLVPQTEQAKAEEKAIQSSNSSSLKRLSVEDAEGQTFSFTVVKANTENKDIWIMQHEVSNALYQSCVSHGKCTKNQVYSTSVSKKRLSEPDMPAVNVSWVMLQSEFIPFIQEKLGHKFRLPSSAEWRSIANNELISNNLGQLDIHCRNCRFSGKVISFGPVPTKSSRAARHELHHFFGNVREWLADCPLDINGFERCDQALIAGGSWMSPYSVIVEQEFDILQKRAKSIDTGFRLVVDFDQ